MYDKYEIKPLMGLVPNKDCDCKKKKDTCKKIEIKPDCGQPHFAVPNYFSELVHEWEKEAARYNLGIQELQSIEYKTEVTDEGERLTKVIFKYRKGHELFTREFYVAPRGEKGDKGDTGKNGASAFEIANMVLQIRNKAEFPNEEAWIDSLKGDKGDPSKPIKSVAVVYTKEENPTGDIREESDGYILTIRLNKPEIDVEETIRALLSYLLEMFYTKDEINSKLNELRALIESLPKSNVDNLKLTYDSRRQIIDLKNDNTTLSSVELNVPEYTLSLENKQLLFKKNNKTINIIPFNFEAFQGDKMEILYTSTTDDNPPQNPSLNQNIWSAAITNYTAGKIIWMATRINGGAWSIIRLTGNDGAKGDKGDKGDRGEDGSDGINGSNTLLDSLTQEFCFFRSDLLTVEELTAILTALNDKNIDHNVIEDIPITYIYNGLSKDIILNDHPKGIENIHGKTCEYFTVRLKITYSNNSENGNNAGKVEYGEFSVPVLWSRWGHDGRDGDGIEYIYAVTNFDSLEAFPENSRPDLWDAVQSDEYTGLKNVTFNGFKAKEGTNNGKWYDTPLEVEHDYKFQWVSMRKKLGTDQKTWGKFSVPVIWNKYLVVDEDNPNITIDVLPRIVTYYGNFTSKKITVYGYRGSDQIKVTKVTKKGESTKLGPENTSGDYYEFNIDNATDTEFEATVKWDNHSITRPFTLEFMKVPDSVDTYSLEVTPSILDVGDDNKISSNLAVKVYFNGKLDTSFNTIDLIATLDNEPLTVNEDLANNLFIVTGLIDKTIETNGKYVTLTLTEGSEHDIVLIQTVPILKNTQNLVTLYIIRNKGKYNSEETYYNAAYDKDQDGNTIALGPNDTEKVYYVDVVYLEDAILNERLEQIKKATYYMPTKYSVKGEEPSDNSPSWKKATGFDFAYISTLISDIIDATSILAKELIVKNNDNAVVAGMTSGNRTSETNTSGLSTNPVRIWAGNTKTSGSGTTVAYDVTNAPFKVYEDGHVIMQSAEIALSTLKSNQDIQLPKWTEGTILYFTITDNNAHKVSVIDDSKIMFFNGSSFSKTSEITINDNGVYFVCGSIINGERIWSVTHTVYKTIIKNALLEEMRDITITSVEVNANDGTVSVYGTIPTDWPSRTYKGCSISINPISYRYYDPDREDNDSDNALGDLSNALLYFTNADVDFSDTDTQLVATSHLKIRSGNDDITNERYYFDSLEIVGTSTSTLQDKIRSLISNPRVIRYYNLDIVLSILVVETNTGLLIDSIDRTICGEIYTNDNEELISNFTNKDCIFTIKKSESSSPTTVYVPSLSTISFAEAQDNYNDYYLEEHQAAVNP